MAPQKISDAERHFLQTVYKNAWRLHEDARLLFEQGRVASSIVLSTFALEDLGKLTSFEPLRPRSGKSVGDHQVRQGHLKRSVTLICLCVAAANVLNRHIAEVFAAVESDSFDPDLAMIFPDPSMPDVAALDSQNKLRFDELWRALEQDQVFVFGMRIAEEVAPQLTRLRFSALYVDHTDGQVTDPSRSDKRVAEQLIEDTALFFRVFQFFLTYINEIVSKDDIS